MKAKRFILSYLFSSFIIFSCNTALNPDLTGTTERHEEGITELKIEKENVASKMIGTANINDSAITISKYKIKAKTQNESKEIDEVIYDPAADTSVKLKLDAGLTWVVEATGFTDDACTKKIAYGTKNITPAGDGRDTLSIKVKLITDSTISSDTGSFKFTVNIPLVDGFNAMECKWYLDGTEKDTYNNEATFECAASSITVGYHILKITVKETNVGYPPAGSEFRDDVFYVKYIPFYVYSNVCTDKFIDGGVYTESFNVPPSELDKTYDASAGKIELFKSTDLTTPLAMKADGNCDVNYAVPSESYVLKVTTKFAGQKIVVESLENAESTRTSVIAYSSFFTDPENATTHNYTQQVTYNLTLPASIDSNGYCVFVKTYAENNTKTEEKCIKFMQAPSQAGNIIVPDGNPVFALSDNKITVTPKVISIKMTIESLTYTGSDVLDKISDFNAELYSGDVKVTSALASGFLKTDNGTSFTIPDSLPNDLYKIVYTGQYNGVSIDGQLELEVER